DAKNLENGKALRVRINDRGPFVRGRIVDLSRAAARELGVIGPGTASVRLTVVAPGIEPAPVSPSGLWTVQIGSFADRSRLERQAERARTVGRPVFLEPYRGLSRVKIGPYDSRAEAEEILRRLEAEGFEGIVVPGGKSEGVSSRESRDDRPCSVTRDARCEMSCCEATGHEVAPTRVDSGSAGVIRCLEAQHARHGSPIE